jgi:hypothetical protein
MPGLPPLVPTDAQVADYPQVGVQTTDQKVRTTRQRFTRARTASAARASKIGPKKRAPMTVHVPVRVSF